MNLSLDPADLRPLVAAVVAETLAALDNAAKQSTGTRLAYSEAEAAALLGVGRHVLRDARLRGEITATKVGGRLAYEAVELAAYLARNREGGA